MKKLYIILALLASVTFYGQDEIAPVWDVTRPNVKTATQMNNMTRMVQGSEIFRSDTKTVWRYVDGVWIDTGTGGGSQNLSQVLTEGNTASDNILMSGFAISGASALTATGRVNTPQVRFTPNNTIGSTVGDNSTGFKTGNIFYIQKVNETNELGFDFNALTADRAVTIPDASGTVAFTSDLTDYVDLASSQTITGAKNFNGTLFANTNGAGNFYVGGSSPTELVRRWKQGKVVDDLTFGYQTTAETNTGGSYLTIATINSTGTPSALTDLVDKEYADANYDQTAAEITTTTTDFDGILSALENTSQKALDILDDINSSNLPHSYDAVVTTVEAELNTLRTGKLNNTISGRIGTTPTGVLIQTEAQIATDGAASSSELVFCSDCGPASPDTGTVLDMSGYGQIDDTAVDTATYTLTNIRDGGYYEVLINLATEPTITGATKIPNTATFIASTEMLMTVKVFGSTVKYFFTEW